MLLNASFAVKIFPNTPIGKRDFKKESAMPGLISDSDFVIKVLECVEHGRTPKAPDHLRKILPDTMRNDYAYILMPKLTDFTLLSFLMRAGALCGQGGWRTLSEL